MKFFIVEKAAARLRAGAPWIYAAFHLDSECYAVHRARELPVEVDGDPVDPPAATLVGPHIVRGRFKGTYSYIFPVSVRGKEVGHVCGRCLREAHRRENHPLGVRLEAARPPHEPRRYPRP